MNFLDINGVKIEKTAGLSPMASVADRAYRLMCKRFGASYLVSEMVSAKGLCYSGKKTENLCVVTEPERPYAIQLFGEEAQFMGRATELLNDYHPDIIDINMGCPVPKVVNPGGGSALMKTPEAAYDIVKACASAANCPVTVKIRAGWDDERINAVQFAKLMEQAGASAIAVHPRTRKQMYSGVSDWSVIKAVKQAVKIPVIGNGDVKDALDCKRMYDETGCDYVTLARGTYGRPWVFRQIKTYFETGILLPEPDIDERVSVMLEHARLIIADKGEKQGIREARKNVAWYIKGLPNAAALRNACCTLETYSDLERMAEDIIKRVDKSE